MRGSGPRMTTERTIGPNSHVLSSGDDAHDVGLLHDQEILAVEHDLGARPLAEQNLVAGLHVRGDDLAGLVAAAGADGDDLALGRLLLGGVGDDDSTLRLFLGIDTLYDHSVVQGTELGLGHIGCPYRLWLMRLSVRSIWRSASTLCRRVPRACGEIGAGAKTVKD